MGREETGQEGSTGETPLGAMAGAEESTTSFLTLQCPLRTSWSIIGNEVN